MTQTYTTLIETYREWIAALSIMMKMQVLVLKPFSIFPKNFLIKISPYKHNHRRTPNKFKQRDKNKIKLIQGLLEEREYKQHKNKTRKRKRKAREEY